MNKVFWTMRNGEQIDIDKMSVSHLRNTLKLIVRMNQEQQSKQEEVDYSHCRAMMRMNAEWKELDGTYVDEYDFYD